MKYYTAAMETGDIIEPFDTLDDARDAIARYETEDKEDGTYTPDFYDIVDEDHESIKEDRNMKMTKDEALAYLDRLVMAKEIIDERQPICDGEVARGYDYTEPNIWVHGLEPLSEIAGYELTVEDWRCPEFMLVSFVHKGRKFCCLKSVIA